MMVFINKSLLVYQTIDEESFELQQVKAQQFVQTVLYLGAQFRGEI